MHRHLFTGATIIAALLAAHRPPTGAPDAAIREEPERDVSSLLAGMTRRPAAAWPTGTDARRRGPATAG